MLSQLIDGLGTTYDVISGDDCIIILHPCSSTHLL